MMPLWGRAAPDDAALPRPRPRMGRGRGASAASASASAGAEAHWSERLSRPKNAPPGGGGLGELAALGGGLLDDGGAGDGIAWAYGGDGDEQAPEGPEGDARRAQEQLLEVLRQAFEDADENGDGQMDESEFQQIRQVLREKLGDSLTPSELNHLFLKIDADCDGGLAWHEVSTALLLRGDKADDTMAEQLAAQTAELMPSVSPPLEIAHGSGQRHRQQLQETHRAPVTQIRRHHPTNSFFTSAMDGTVRSGTLSQQATRPSVRSLIEGACMRLHPACLPALRFGRGARTWGRCSSLSRGPLVQPQQTCCRTPSSSSATPRRRTSPSRRSFCTRNGRSSPPPRAPMPTACLPLRPSSWLPEALTCRSAGGSRSHRLPPIPVTNFCFCSTKHEPLPDGLHAHDTWIAVLGMDKTVSSRRWQQRAEDR
jgi:hypothetical protein